MLIFDAIYLFQIVCIFAIIKLNIKRYKEKHILFCRRRKVFFLSFVQEFCFFFFCFCLLYLNVQCFAWNLMQFCMFICLFICFFFPLLFCLFIYLFLKYGYLKGKRKKHKNNCAKIIYIYTCKYIKKEYQRKKRLPDYKRIVCCDNCNRCSQNVSPLLQRSLFNSYHHLKYIITVIIIVITNNSFINRHYHHYQHFSSSTQKKKNRSRRSLTTTSSSSHQLTAILALQKAQS